MMSPEKSDLSPRLRTASGDSLFSPTFDRDPSSLESNHGFLVIPQNDLIALSETLEQALDSADATISGLEADRKLLPSAILRKCHEFADGLGALAAELEQQSESDRKLLVEAIQNDLLLLEHDLQPQDEIIEYHHKPTDDNILHAIVGASTLLRDVEASFREIGNEEAEEIADAALIMARLFLLSLQNISANLSKQIDADSLNIETTTTTTTWIEELNGDENDNNKNQPPPMRKCNKHRRMRVLWPPLGPTVDSAMDWTKTEATKRPVLSVALGLTLWPVAISTALLGTSIYCIDWALQNTYNHFQHSSWIAIAEESAAQAYQTTRLMVATTKLVTKQSLKVASKQIERQGGIQPILQDLTGMVVDRVTHPIDTAGRVWDGLHWSWGVLNDAKDEFWRLKKQESAESLL